jgi:hypothetical protein
MTGHPASASRFASVAHYGAGRYRSLMRFGGDRIGRSRVTWPSVALPILLLLVALPSVARAASCVCADRDGCVVDAACDGAVPGDACAPDVASSCRIIVGTNADATCCCTCGRGVGPRSCVFGPVRERAAALGSTIDCGAAARRATTKAVADLRARLSRAETACRDGARSAARHVDGSRRRLERLRRRLARLVERGKTTAECAARLGTAVDVLDAEIDDVAARGMPGGTSPVTTTTLPGTAPSCTGTAAPDGGFGLDVAFVCPSGPERFTAFSVLVPSRHEITGFTAPPGFACAKSTWNTPNDLWTCTGEFVPGTSVAGGRLVLDPAPSLGLGASLWVERGPARFGPFPLGDPS